MAALTTRGTLRLTTPATTGPLVRRFQNIVATRAHALHLTVPKGFADGEWGPQSARLARQVGWLLGISTSALDGGWTPRLRRIVAFPSLRGIAARRAAGERQDAARRGPAAAIAYATAFVGVTENPAGTNTGPDVTATVRGEQVTGGISRWLAAVGIRGYGAPWCGAFAGAAARHGGAPVTDRVRYCPFIVADAGAGTGGFTTLVTPRKAQPGDLVLCYGTALQPDHVELCIEAAGADGIRTVGGNTSAGVLGSQNNGGGVYRRTRSYSEVVAVARPAYPGASK